MVTLLLVLQKSKTIIFGIDSTQYLNLIPHVSPALQSRLGTISPTGLKVAFGFATQIVRIGIPPLHK